MNIINKQRLARIHEITDILDKMIVGKKMDVVERKEYFNLVDERQNLSSLLASGK
jgi:hypothetical protein